MTETNRSYTDAEHSSIANNITIC